MPEGRHRSVATQRHSELHSSRASHSCNALQFQDVRLDFSDGSSQDVHLENDAATHMYALQPVVTTEVEVTALSIYGGTNIGAAEIWFESKRAEQCEDCMAGKYQPGVGTPGDFPTAWAGQLPAAADLNNWRLVINIDTSDGHTVDYVNGERRGSVPHQRLHLLLWKEPLQRTTHARFCFGRRLLGRVNRRDGDDDRQLRHQRTVRLQGLQGCGSVHVPVCVKAACGGSPRRPVCGDARVESADAAAVERLLHWRREWAGAGAFTALTHECAAEPLAHWAPARRRCQVTNGVIADYESGTTSSNDGIIRSNHDLFANVRSGSNDYERLAALSAGNADMGDNVNWGLGTCNDGYGRGTGQPYCDAQVRICIADAVAPSCAD